MSDGEGWNCGHLLETLTGCDCEYQQGATKGAGTGDIEI